MKLLLTSGGLTNESISDDQSALKIIGGKIEVITEGKYLKLDERVAE